MPSLTRNLVLFAIAVAALAGGYWLSQWLRAPSAAVSSASGQLWEFTLPDVDGRPRHLGEWRDKILILNFWATWCPPCREEIPLLIAVQKKYAAQGVQVVGLALDRAEGVKAYGVSAGINYPLLVHDSDMLKIMELYGNRSGALPFSVVLDRQGTIVARKLGAFRGAELENILKPVISARPNR
jgi:thiol-disulfide isomerase/thioredoxin